MPVVVGADIVDADVVPQMTRMFGLFASGIHVLLRLLAGRPVDSERHRR
jgi:hypothetical protein